MQKAEQLAQAWPVLPPEPASSSDDWNGMCKQDKTLSKIWREMRCCGALGSDQYWVMTAPADFFFGGWICVNAFVLAIETDARTEMNEDDLAWTFLDSTFNVVFMLEMMLRLRAERRRWIRDVWNIFDAILVFIGVLDSWILPVTGLTSDMRFITLMRLFRLLRLIRVLRVLRLLRFMKELMLLVQGITSAMRAMVWGLLLLGITIFICALLLTRLVGKACCDSEDTFQNPLFHELFGTFTRTSFTLLQFTMEFQPDICRDTWDYGPWLTIFFVAYTVFTNITLLNTVASVIVENILSIAQQNQDEIKAKKDAEAAEITRKYIEQLFEMADTDGDRMISKEEVAASNPAIHELLQMSGGTLEQAANMFNVMDVDCSGSISREEFQMALFRGSHALEASDVLRIQCQVDAVKTIMSKQFEDIQEQNLHVLQVLSRLEGRQVEMQGRQVVMEDELASLGQPHASELDKMSVRFVRQQPNAPVQGKWQKDISIPNLQVEANHDADPQEDNLVV